MNFFRCDGNGGLIYQQDPYGYWEDRGNYNVPRADTGEYFGVADDDYGPYGSAFRRNYPRESSRIYDPMRGYHPDYDDVYDDTVEYGDDFIGDIPSYDPRQDREAQIAQMSGALLDEERHNPNVLRRGRPDRHPRPQRPEPAPHCFSNMGTRMRRGIEDFSDRFERRHQNFRDRVHDGIDTALDNTVYRAFDGLERGFRSLTASPTRSRHEPRRHSNRRRPSPRLADGSRFARETRPYIGGFSGGVPAFDMPQVYDAGPEPEYSDWVNGRPVSMIPEVGSTYRGSRYYGPRGW